MKAKISLAKPKNWTTLTPEQKSEWWLGLTPQQVEKYRHDFIKSTLRKASHRWPYRNIALQRARIGRGMYACASCKRSTPNKEKKLDHVAPVVDPLSGFKTWDVYGDRLLVFSDGWQVLCKDCHQEKTNQENQVRRGRGTK